MLEGSCYAKMANEVSSRTIKIDPVRLEIVLGAYWSGRAAVLCKKACRKGVESGTQETWSIKHVYPSCTNCETYYRRRLMLSTILLEFFSPNLAIVHGKIQSELG